MGATSDHEPASTADATATRSFEVFFTNHYRAVVRLAHSVVGDFHSAQDVAQEVFLAAHRRFQDDFDEAAGWVRVASVHTALNMVRGRRRQQRRHALAGSAPSAPSAEDTVLERESRAEVRRALTKLPRKSATLLVLRHGGMSYLEIADALGINVGQVGTTLRRAEAALCKHMAQCKEMDRGTRI
jgi:RNA polymerase sigma-70 factor (ECF subfamily)